MVGEIVAVAPTWPATKLTVQVNVPAALMLTSVPAHVPVAPCVPTTVGSGATSAVPAPGRTSTTSTFASPAPELVTTMEYVLFAPATIDDLLSVFVMLRTGLFSVVTSEEAVAPFGQLVQFAVALFTPTEPSAAALETAGTTSVALALGASGLVAAGQLTVVVVIVQVTSTPPIWKVTEPGTRSKLSPVPVASSMSTAIAGAWPTFVTVTIQENDSLGVPVMGFFDGCFSS